MGESTEENSQGVSQGLEQHQLQVKLTNARWGGSHGVSG